MNGGIEASDGALAASGWAAPRKAASVKWAGKTIALGTFTAAEGEAKCAMAKALTKAWRATMVPKPPREWVMLELERLGVRVVGGGNAGTTSSRDCGNGDAAASKGGAAAESSCGGGQEPAAPAPAPAPAAPPTEVSDALPQVAPPTAEVSDALPQVGRDSFQPAAGPAGRRDSLGLALLADSARNDSFGFGAGFGAGGFGADFGVGCDPLEMMQQRRKSSLALVSFLNGDAHALSDAPLLPPVAGASSPASPSNNADPTVPAHRPLVGGGSAAAYEAARADHYRKLSEHGAGGVANNVSDNFGGGAGGLSAIQQRRLSELGTSLGLGAGGANSNMPDDFGGGGGAGGLSAIQQRRLSGLRASLANNNLLDNFGGGAGGLSAIQQRRLSGLGTSLGLGAGGANSNMPDDFGGGAGGLSAIQQRRLSGLGMSLGLGAGVANNNMPDDFGGGAGGLSAVQQRRMSGLRASLGLGASGGFAPASAPESSGLMAAMEQIGAATGATGALGNTAIPNKHYEMLKKHHMNLLSELQETTMMMKLYQEQQMQQQQQMPQQQMMQQQNEVPQQHMVQQQHTAPQHQSQLSDYSGGGGVDPLNRASTVVGQHNNSTMMSGLDGGVDDFGGTSQMQSLIDQHGIIGGAGMGMSLDRGSVGGEFDGVMQRRLSMQNALQQQGLHFDAGVSHGGGVNEAECTEDQIRILKAQIAAREIQMHHLDSAPMSNKRMAEDILFAHGEQIKRMKGAM